MLVTICRSLVFAMFSRLGSKDVVTKCSPEKARICTRISVGNEAHHLIIRD